MADEPPRQDEMNLIDPELYTILADLEKSDKCLSPPDTEKAVDYALIRLVTSIALESHEELGLESKLNVDEYQIINKAFENEYGDERLVLVLFYKQLHETIVEHVVNGRHKLSRHEKDLSEHRKKLIDQRILQEEKKFLEKKKNGTIKERDREEISQYVIDLLRMKEIIDDKDLSFPMKYSKDYMDLIMKKIITENKILALHYEKKSEEATDPERKSTFENAADFHARVHNHLKDWKGQFSIEPLWGRALKFLDVINFRKEFNGYSRRKEIAVKAVLELYDITGVSLQTIADRFDELREFHGESTDQQFCAEEGRWKKFSKNSKKGQTYLTFLYKTDPMIGFYIAQEIFGYDTDEITKHLKTIMKETLHEQGFEFETEKLWFSQDAADAYIKQRHLGRRKARDEESSRIKLKKLKSESDRIRMNIIETMNELQGLIEFAYSDRVYTSEEIEILKVLGGLKYGVRDENVFETMLEDSKNMKIVVLDKGEGKYSSVNMQLRNTSCDVLHVAHFGELYDKHINTEKAPQIVLVGRDYQSEGIKHGEIIEFLVGDTKSTSHMRSKNINIFMLGSAIPGGDIYQREAREAQTLGVSYVSTLDQREILRVIHDYGMEKPGTEQERGR